MKRQKASQRIAFGVPRGNDLSYFGPNHVQVYAVGSDLYQGQRIARRGDTAFPAKGRQGEQPLQVSGIGAGLGECRHDVVSVQARLQGTV